MSIMDILQYTEAHKDFRARLRDFVAQEITPFAAQWEIDKGVPREIWRRMGREGFLCTDLGPEYGGRGGDFLYSLIVTEEMSRTGITGVAAALHSDIVVPYITAFGSDEQKGRWLPGCVSGDIVTAVAMTEPDAGSDLAGMKTSAVADGEAVILNGSKTFISNGLLSDLVIVAARDTDSENPHLGISLYVVEEGTAGFRRGRKLAKMGWHSQDTAELFFSDCRIPVSQRLGQKGMGFIMLMEKLQQERIVASMGAVAAAERIMEWTLGYCTTTRENGRPLSKRQAVQFALVEMLTEVKLGRTFLEKLIADHMEKQSIVVEVSMAKYWTTDLAKRLAARSLDLIGAPAMLESCPVTRALRDVRVMSIFAGTNEIMKGIAAKFLRF
jgi:acyl-CoA dehydrogenase